jgi:hypothetical protein
MQQMLYRQNHKIAALVNELFIENPRSHVFRDMPAAQRLEMLQMRRLVRADRATGLAAVVAKSKKLIDDRINRIFRKG